MYNDVFFNLIGSLSMRNDTCISVLDGLYMYIYINTANTRICIIFTTQSYSVVEINTSIYECILSFR